MSEIDPTQQTPLKKPPRLLDQVRYQTRLLHDSIRTEEAYVGWIGGIVSFG